MQAAHLELQVLAQLLVERAQRLVHQQQRAARRRWRGRARRAAAGRRKAGADSARRSPAAAPVRAPRRPAARASAFATPRCFSGKADVVGHRHVREQRVVLEHHADVAAVRRQRDDRLAVDGDVAGGRHLEAGDHHQGRGLARAARAEQGQELARADVERDAATAATRPKRFSRSVRRPKRRAPGLPSKSGPSMSARIHLFQRPITVSRLSTHHS